MASCFVLLVLNDNPIFVVLNRSDKHTDIMSKTSAETWLRQAAGIQLDLEDDMLSFSFTGVDGSTWEGCVEEWIGNESLPQIARDPVVDFEGAKYFLLGSSGGGADLVLLRHDDGSIWYLNDFDCTLARVATDLTKFIALLCTPAE